MKTVKLGDVCTIVSGSTPSRKIDEYWNGNIPWVTPKEISRLKSRFLWDSAEKITDAGFKSCSTNLLPANSLLLSSRAPIGLLAINKIPVCTNQGFKSLIPNNNINVEYLYYVLKKNTSRLQSLGNGATFKELSKSSLESFQIPFPSLPDQIRIAALLSKVEALITQRKTHLQQLDTFLKSIFIDLFGDPVKNEKGWEDTTIGELASEVKYGTSAPAKGGGYTYLRMNNITQEGHWNFQRLKSIELSESEFKKYSVKSGELVFNRTNSKELVGKTAVYKEDKPAVIAGYLIRVRFRDETNPWFVWGHLNSKYGKSYLFNLCRNIVGMANINSKELQSIPILNPPLALQNHFAAIVEKVEALKTRYEQSLADLETLYAALSQKAFSSTLDLSRIQIA